MPKYNIFVRKKINERFSKEPQKSALVSLLLERHYDRFLPGTLIKDAPEDVGTHPLDKILHPSLNLYKCGHLAKSNGKGCLNMKCTYGG